MPIPPPCSVEEQALFEYGRHMQVDACLSDCQTHNRHKYIHRQKASTYSVGIGFG